MDRRLFSKLLIGALTASGLPGGVQARTLIGQQQAFKDALAEKPWLIGYMGAPSVELHGAVQRTTGTLPPSLKGSFLRNGPALHDIGPDRFMHWFDAPGMLQKFTFANGTVTHHGRLINTARNRQEVTSGRIEFNGFGTHGHTLTSGGSADAQSPANISLVEHAGELLALWEGGSAHVMDADTLDTKGVKTWSAETEGLPFGAHPRRDADGSLWNIGYSASPQALILYHISAAGALQAVQVLPQSHVSMVHDFMITPTRIVIVMPPYTASQPADKSFLDRFNWARDDSTRILVIDKNDLTNVTEIETDPFWAFHYGNAYDISPTEIGFDFAIHDTPVFMTHESYDVMNGTWDGHSYAAQQYMQMRLDTKARRAYFNGVPEFSATEFIKIDPREELTRHRYALMVSQTSQTETYGFNRLLLVDRNTGGLSHFDAGATEMFEEHLIVPNPDNAEAFWIIGTSLNWQTARSSLSVYDGHHLADGPVYKAELDIALPLGLHGIFLRDVA